MSKVRPNWSEESEVFAMHLWKYTFGKISEKTVDRQTDGTEKSGPSLINRGTKYN